LPRLTAVKKADKSDKPDKSDGKKDWLTASWLGDCTFYRRFRLEEHETPVSPREEDFAGGLDAIHPAALRGSRLGLRLRAASKKGGIKFNGLTRGRNVGRIRGRFKNVRCS
jgi:hypothetical protein